MPYPPNLLRHIVLSEARIIELGETDVTALTTLYALCFDDIWSPDSFLSLFQASHATAFGVAENDKLVGFILLTPCVDDMEIIKIATHPDHRRSGLGWRLMKAAIDYAQSKNSDRLLLEVAATNMSAQRLYEKSGFRKDGIRPKYYQQPGANPIDAILMSLDL